VLESQRTTSQKNNLFSLGSLILTPQLQDSNSRLPFQLSSEHAHCPYIVASVTSR